MEEILMKKFLDYDYLLTNDTAKKLYHDYAKEMPIIDYHCHLNPKEIYENKKFENITQVWLVSGNYGDHYKWRLLRAFGVTEEYITGNKSAYEKFEKWAETIPYTIGNPLYQWTHLELRRFFGIEEQLSPKTAKKIFDACNEKLKTEDFTPRKLMENSHVKAVCTTDDPCDSLEYHIKLKNEYDKVKVLPAFRPDKAVNIELGWFTDYIKRLSDVVEYQIMNLNDLLKALESRIDFFHEVGCRLSDHALDTVMYKDATYDEVNQILVKRLSGETLTTDEIKQFKGFIMLFFGRAYTNRNWVMQFHIAALRNTNTLMFEKIGPDTGYDATNESVNIIELKQLLDKLAYGDALPKTILYSLNPNDHPLLASLMGTFQDGGAAGKMQLGSAWWFNDHIDGMLEQMKALANVGLLSKFVGMLTDSRSFLSYPRHEYFRRILCNLIGEWVEGGLYPDDFEILGKIVQDISYHNAMNYFNI